VQKQLAPSTRPRFDFELREVTRLALKPLVALARRATR